MKNNLCNYKSSLCGVIMSTGKYLLVISYQFEILNWTKICLYFPEHSLSSLNSSPTLTTSIPIITIIIITTNTHTTALISITNPWSDIQHSSLRILLQNMDCTKTDTSHKMSELNSVHCPRQEAEACRFY